MKCIIVIFFFFATPHVISVGHEIAGENPILKQKIYFSSAEKIKIYLDHYENFEKFYTQSGAISAHGKIMQQGWLAKIENSKMTILEAIIVVQMSMLDHAEGKQNCDTAFDCHQRVLQVLFKGLPGVCELLYKPSHLQSKI